MSDAQRLLLDFAGRIEAVRAKAEAAANDLPWLVGDERQAFVLKLVTTLTQQMTDEMRVYANLYREGGEMAA